MRRTYSLWQCPVCKEQISSNGLSRTNHCKKHVREGTMRAVPETSLGLPTGSYYYEVVTKPACIWKEEEWGEYWQTSCDKACNLLFAFTEGGL